MRHFHFKNKLAFLSLLVFWGSASPTSAIKLRIYIQNANLSENLKTKVIETKEGKKKNLYSIIEGSNKRGLLLDLDQENVAGDLKRLKFVFPGPEQGQRENFLTVTFSKEFLQAAGEPQTTKVKVTKVSKDRETVQEFSYITTRDEACPAGSEPWATRHHLHLKILPQEKDVEITNSRTDNCE